jgi:excisionase family DNA binding protein
VSHIKRDGITLRERENNMPLLTARQLCEAEGIPAGTVYRLAKAGLIPAYRVGAKRRGIRFDAAEVRAAIRQPAVAELNGKAHEAS